jgi:hypothetical protein
MEAKEIAERLRRMDVILDSNIYLSDIRLARAGFEGLFAYSSSEGTQDQSNP